MPPPGGSPTKDDELLARAARPVRRRNMTTQAHDPRSAVCPWCQEAVQLAFPDLVSPPEFARVTRPGFELDAQVRLVETFDCPNCRKEMKVSWYGGIRW